MSAQRLTALAAAGVLLLASGAVAGQAKPASKPAAAPAKQVAAAPAKPARLAPPVRGEAELGYTKPEIKRDAKFIHTKIRVKNLSKGAIAGLRVDEYWYDAKGDPVTGDTWRDPHPLQPGEVTEVELNTPVNPRMNRNQYQFKHANGTIKTKALTKIE
jgi:hypothetical protein